MTNVLLTNSYQILGLNNTATQREIIKRSKDILSLLAIDEKPEYDLDLGIFNKLRTESKVKEAARNLAVPKNRIKEYFFSFDIQDLTDKKAISFVQELDFSKARDVWKGALEKNNSNANLYKKNLAILDLWILYEKDERHTLKESVDLWKELIESEEFWDAYSKIYKLNDDLDTSLEVIQNFRKDVSSMLSDTLADIGKKNNTDIYLKEFVRLFGVKGEAFDKTVLTPIFQEINKNLSVLAQIKLDQDKLVEQITKNGIIKTIKDIELSMNQFVKFGVYEDSEVIVLRDKVAMTIKSLAIDISDTAKDYKFSLEILKSALLFVSTELTRSKINDNIVIIKGNAVGLELEDVMKLVNENKLEEALEIVNSKLKNEELSKDARLQLEEFKKSNEERVKIQGKPVKNAPPLFTIWGFGTRIYGNTLYLTALYFPVLPLARYTLQDQGNGKYLFYGKLPFTTKQRWWFWIGLIIGAILLISFMVNSGNSTTTPTSGSTNSSSVDCSNVNPGQYCCSADNITQADSLKPDSSTETQLQEQYTKISNERSSLDNTDQTAVDALNAEVDQYNLDRDAYNSKLDQYNNFLSKNCTLK